MEPDKMSEISPGAQAEVAAPPISKWDAWLNDLNWEPVSGEAFNKLSKDEQLHAIRHSTAHLMASALQNLHPETQFAIGPATQQGFFYDVKTSESLKTEDLEAIQAEMNKIAGRSQKYEVTSIPREKALELFKDLKQDFKLEIIARITDETVTLYRHGKFIDLCAGPHVPHTGILRNNKLLNLSAVHWRGEDHPSLTRITGTAWARPKDLDNYMEFLEEVKNRDHRVLGPQLDLFSFHQWAASALWHPNGVSLRQELMALWRETISASEYVEIMNPLLYQKELFQTSGHWDHFQENMFIFKDADGEPSYALKPMNCPDTMLFFQSQIRSYRDLPLRIAEGQILHRNEVTGSLHGIMRTRNFVQDDAHIFLSAEHVEAEVLSLLEMIDKIYNLFELKYNIHLSTRPENFMGELATWDQAEAGLKTALEKAGYSYVLDEGEGAFYGPKIDVYIQDSLGREWQCGTVQLDFQQPERFELKYTQADGTFARPIVIHRAIFGSFERFMGILIEHLGGAFPTWLAPVQVHVLPISDRHVEYATELKKELKAKGIRAKVDDTETINYRIRHAETLKIPYMLVVGDREAENRSVSVRTYTAGVQGVKSVDEITAEILEKIKDRTFDVKVKEFSSLFRSNPNANVEEEDGY